MDPVLAALLARSSARAAATNTVSHELSPPQRSNPEPASLPAYTPAPSFPPRSKASKDNKYRDYSEQGLERAFFEARAKTTRSSIAQDISEWVESPFTSQPRSDAPAEYPVKSASQFHRERHQKRMKTFSNIGNEFDRRGMETPDKSEDGIVKAVRAVRDAAGGIKETPKGGAISQLGKFFKNL